MVDDEQFRSLIGMLREVAHHAYGFTLISGPPKNTERYQRISKPRAGDLVMEVSTFWWPDRDMDAIGWLLRETAEPVPYEAWDEAVDGPHPTERVFYIKTLDGREYRWTNAMFVTVPLCGMADSPESENYQKPRFPNCFQKTSGDVSNG